MTQRRDNGVSLEPNPWREACVTDAVQRESRQKRRHERRERKLLVFIGAAEEGSATKGLRSARNTRRPGDERFAMMSLARPRQPPRVQGPEPSSLRRSLYFSGYALAPG